MDGMPMKTPAGPDAMSASATEPSTFHFTSPGPEPTSSVGMGDMGDTGQTGNMDMSEGSCKISMLWNWETIDACFLSKSWQIKSRGGFAGLCIGVILLVVLLELLRRVSKMYDKYLIHQHQKRIAHVVSAANSSSETANGSLITKNHRYSVSAVPFRPSFWQQAIRALLHTLQFALAYWIMLLAMYYNGYIIICIIIGAFIGSFIFQWEPIGSRTKGIIMLLIPVLEKTLLAVVDELWGWGFNTRER